MKTTVLCFAILALGLCSASKMLRAIRGERAGFCPPPSGMAGICVFDPNINCLADSECSAGQKCCHEGCGKICKDAVTQQVHTGSCPAPSSEVGICVLLPNHCSSDGDCASDEKCCQEGCNMVCKSAIQTVVG